MTKSAILKPDLKQAGRFIDSLTGVTNGAVCFQVFPERPGSSGFPWFAHGTLEEMVQKLIRAQREGCGVFVVVNETDGQGRKAANIKNARASFVDLDRPGLPSFEVQPDLIVQTSHDRHHAYWLLLPDENLERASALQVRMATYYNGDLTVCDPSRVMRLPGFWHQKGDPFLVTLVHACPEEDASMDGFGRRLMEVLEEKHPCWFEPPKLRHAEDRVEAPPAGWDNDIDVRYAVRFLQDEASPAIEGRNGDYTTFAVACSLRDRGISESCAFDLLSEHYNDRCSPPWDDNELLNKVQNAYAYANGGAGSNSIASDFFEDADFNGELDKDVDGPIQRLSRKYCTAVDGNLRIMYLDESPEMPGRRYWKSMSDKAFCLHYANRKVEIDGKKVPLGKAWLESPDRPSAIAFTFDTSASPAADINARIKDGRLNLWTGYGITPIQKEDGWRHFEAMIRDDLCTGKNDYYDYVIKWIAYKIQNPDLPAETSIALRGPKGVGKTTLGQVLVDAFGSHGLVVSRRSQFAGQFSGHLATACFVFADEAVWGGNKEDEGTLKKLITDRHVLYRAMYKEETYGVNRVGLLMATNEEWAVPATFDERRFVVLEVSGKHRVRGPDDLENRAYWDAIYSELKDGGREAFLYDMLSMELGDWTPRLGAPRTEALGSQILESLRGIERWYYELLTEGELPADAAESPPDWSMSGHLVRYKVLLSHCRFWMRSNRQQAAITPRGLATKLKPFGWKPGRDSSARGLVAPSHVEAIAIFEKRLGCKIFS